jgi:hypothetical protein
VATTTPSGSTGRRSTAPWPHCADSDNRGRQTL